MDEAGELEPERVLVRYHQLHPLDQLLQPRRARLAPSVPEPHELSDAGAEVEGEVAVRLEDPEPAHPLSRDPRRGHVGHRARGKLDPRVRHVEMRREHRHAAGPDVGRRGAAGQVENEIEIVDHEIEHHRDVGAAGLKRRQPVALQIAGLAQVGAGGPHRAVEPLDVAHLQRGAAALRRVHQEVGLLQRRGERLLHQDRAPPLQGPEPHLGVRGGGHRHGHRLGVGEQRVEIGVEPHAAGAGDLAAAGPVDVVHADQGGVLGPRQVARVVVPEGADADHADGKPGHQAGTPRWELETNSRKRSTSGSGGSSARARSTA